MDHDVLMSLTFESSRFGTVEISPDDVIEFPTGLIGLGGSRYALVSGEPDAPFRWLHSLDDADLALPVTNPWLFFEDYAVELSDAESERIGVADADEPEVWVTVRAAERLEDFTANLRAPILVAGGRGHQVINESGGDVRAPLFPDGAPGAAS